MLLGHAFGNRVVRMASARKPEAVKALILLAAGGKTKMPPDIEAALLQSFDLALPEGEGYSTVAGLCIARLGAVPAVGARLRAADAELEVVEATPRLVRRLRVRRLPAGPPAEGPGAPAAGPG